MSCYNCKNPIWFDPFKCEKCNNDLCLNCSNDICGACTALDLNQKKILKCENFSNFICTNDAIINQKCESLKNVMNYGKRHNKKCPNKILVCSEHLNTCEKCNAIVCLNCYNNICQTECIQCVKCKNSYAYILKKYDNMINCNICDKYICGSCLYNVMDVTSFESMNLCFSHIEKCVICNSMSVVNDVRLKCQYKNCNKVTCRTCWFESNINDTIRVCHNHVEKCQECNLLYPSTNMNIIKFRNGKEILNCSNCHKDKKECIDLILKLEIQSKDIIDYILMKIFL